VSRARRLLFLEPFDGGSHRAFARGWAAHSRHRIRVETLPARAWKWRLRGAAWTFAERASVRTALGGGEVDAVVATSLLNAADFRATARLGVPLVLYVHENQLRYPRPPGEPLDHGLALTALASAAAADALVFNSRFHLRDFFDGLEEWLRRFPERAPARTVRALRRRSTVISPGIDGKTLAALAARRTVGRRGPRSGERPSRDGRDAGGEAPLILWNHRWEFDKNAGAFFAALGALGSRGLDFRLALLGENTQFVPKLFLAARERFGPKILRYGFVPSRRDYLRWLGRADIVVSTARQENFGLSVVEAIAAGLFPVLPRRLSYPEILPGAADRSCFYTTQAELVSLLADLLAGRRSIAEGRARRARAMQRFDWRATAPKLDDLVERIVARGETAQRGDAPKIPRARATSRSAPTGSTLRTRRRRSVR